MKFISDAFGYSVKFMSSTYATLIQWALHLLLARGASQGAQQRTPRPKASRRTRHQPT